MKLWSYIREKMLETPEQTLCEGDAVITYEELCVFAEHYAKNLNASYYAILCHSELAAAMALIACIAAGKPAVPFPMRYGKEYYQKIWDKAHAPYVITDVYGKLSCHAVYPEDTAVQLPQSSAVILFTSGSTGVPKGVVLNESNLLSNIQGISSYFPINKADTILISRPLYHSSVLTGEFLVALCNNAKIVFSSEPFQPLNILSLIKKHGITVLGSTPTLLSVLSRFIRKETEHNVRLLSISGECITEGMARTIRNAFPHTDIYCGYGLSEASPRVAYLPPLYFDSCPTSAGFTLPNVHVCIKGKDGLIWDTYRSGELLVKGPNVMQGYFGDAERTSAVIENGWLHTGDIACWDDAGMFHIQGRKDDMIIRAGMNIYPAEVENAVSTDPRVKDVLVYGYPKDGRQEVGMKICGEFSDIKEVMQLCREQLPVFQIPSKIELVDETEVFSGGKKRRKNF